jgi:lipopolysaccharide export system permease protein
MKILQNYILKNLSALFFSTFLPLFAIASVIFSIKLATYTAVIKLSIVEMGKLYMFMMPELLFYILPISFFIAAALAIFKFSNDNEMVVIFSLGIHPSFIAKTLFLPALFLSGILVFNFYYLFPHSKILADNFKRYKRSEAQFNLSASEFGNSFGDWLLYLGTKNEKENSFGDVFLFNKNAKEEILISAHKAQVINDSGILKLKLSHGEGYLYSADKFSQINFKTMFINDKLHTNLHTYKKPYGYWFEDKKNKSKEKTFIIDALLSLFPIISIFLVLTISIVQTRHQQSHVYLYLFLGTLTYYGLTIGLSNILHYYTIPFVSVLWLVVTYTMYRKLIVNKF